MRTSWLVALAPLAGCHLLFHAEPSQGAGDDDALDPDGRSVVIDGSCMGAVGNDELLIEGTWFVADRATQRAVMFHDDVWETVGNVDTHSFGDYHKILEPKPQGIDNYDAPRLSPGGLELFVVMEDAISDVRTLGRATNDGTSWSAVEAVVVQDEQGLTIDDLELISTSPPTTTSPRRMLMSNGIDILELEEQTPLLWRGRARISPTSLGVSAADTAMLTPDGMQIIFTATSGIRIGTRTALDTPFAGSDVLYDSGGSGSRSAPFYTVDCQKHLYYPSLFNIHHIILP